MNTLDHILWAAPDLDAGIAELERRLGARAAPGGRHPGFGTRNALLGLGAGVYLEILSPDPEQELAAGTRGAVIAAMPASRLYTFAIRTSDIEDVARRARAAGLAPEGPFAMSRDRPDGRRLAWKLLHLHGHAFGDLMPFFIDWQDSPHPSGDTPPGGVLRDFAVLHPAPTELARLFAALAIDVPVREATTPGLEATIETPKGRVRLAG